MDPTKRRFPGFGYRRTVENGLIIEKDVAVTMRDGVDLFWPDNREDLPLETSVRVWVQHCRSQARSMICDYTSRVWVTLEILRRAR